MITMTTLAAINQHGEAFGKHWKWIASILQNVCARPFFLSGTHLALVVAAAVGCGCVEKLEWKLGIGKYLLV